MAYDEDKFKAFNLVLKCDAEVVIINHPQVLGDDYEELCENLNRLARTRKSLSIVSPEDRGKKK